MKIKIDKLQPVIGFGLIYANQLYYCEVAMNEESYTVFLNNKYTAEITYTSDFDWMLIKGLLTYGIIQHIGWKIESAYA